MFMKRLLMGLVTSTALLALSMPSAAHADGAFRTVLVIDASSSMRRTDPDELRKVAAELFVDLARRGDEIAVTGFDERARQSTGEFITITGPESRERIKEAIRAIGNDGKWTDFTAGLDEARRLLDSVVGQPGDQALILFLTDGRCEPDPRGALAQGVASPREREQACQDQVLGPMASSLGGARVYAIGLSKNAPAAFLEELGRRTGGQGVATHDARDLPQLFAGVYARLLGSRLQEGDASGQASFEVYEGAAVLDLVIVGRADRTGTLTAPTGEIIAIDNRAPDKIYFVAAREYRFYKIHRPRPGIWTLEAGDKGTRRFATLQHFDLALALVDTPAAIEKGRSLTLRARLAAPSGAMPPMEFLDRHAMFALIRENDQQDALTRLEMKRQHDGTFAAELVAATLGELALGLELEPRSEGVLSRQARNLASVSVIPPVHLRAAAVDAGAIKQGQSAEAILSMAGSEVGVPLELGLALASDPAGEPGGEPGSEHDPAGARLIAAMTMKPGAVTMAPAGKTEFTLTLAVGKDAPPGRRDLVVIITPTAPEGFADREVKAPLTIEVVPLSFWERHGRTVQYGAGAVIFLIIVLGLALPARFKKRAILYYADVRDPDMIRRSSYPLGTRARRGFYRPARLALGPTGPVKKGGAVRLQAGPGGAIEAIPLVAGATVLKTPVTAEGEGEGDEGDQDELARAAKAAASDDDDDRPRVPLKDGRFRMAAGVGYQIKGSGLVFWYK